MQNLKLVVTGTGRCGTNSLSHWLTEAGIPCGHERIFTVRGVSGANGLWADSSWLAAPHLPSLSCPILHLVRHPLRVLSSLEGIRFLSGGITENNALWAAYALRWVPRLNSLRNSVEKHMRFILDWNAMIQRKATARLQLEEATPARLIEILQEVAPPLLAGRETRIREIPLRRLNHRPTSNLALADLPRGAVRDEFLAQALAYGYEM